jgi:hypothetical protein
MKVMISSILMGALIALPMQHAEAQAQLPPEQVAKNEESARLLESLLQGASEQAQQEAVLRMATVASATGQRTAANSGPPIPPPGPGGSGQITSTNTSPVVYSPPPEPQIVLPVMAILFYIGLGALVLFFGYYIYLQWRTFWDKVLGDPVPPPNPPVQPPDTNGPPSDPYPASLPNGAKAALNVGVSGAASAMDLTRSNWLDTISGNGAKWTNIVQTTLQAKENLTAPWTNFLTVTVWSSSSGAHEILVRDRNFNPVYTNYSKVLTAGSWTHFVGNFERPWTNPAAPPMKLYRLAARPD